MLELSDLFWHTKRVGEHSHVNHNVRQQPATESRTLGISHLHNEKRSVKGFFRTFRFAINDEENYDPSNFW